MLEAIVKERAVEYLVFAIPVYVLKVFESLDRVDVLSALLGHSL